MGLQFSSNLEISQPLFLQRVFSIIFPPPTLPPPKKKIHPAHHHNSRTPITCMLESLIWSHSFLLFYFFPIFFFFSILFRIISVAMSLCSLTFSSETSNLMLLLPTIFCIFISDNVFFMSRISIWVFFSYLPFLS